MPLAPAPWLRRCTIAWIAVATANGCATPHESTTTPQRQSSGGTSNTGATGGSLSLAAQPGDLALSGSGGSGGSDLVPVVPPWSPPDADDNCGAHCYFAPELPQGKSATPKDLFQGSGTTAAPVIAYPLGSSVHPLNMLSVTVQWKRTARTHEYAWLHLAGVTDWDFYLPCQHVRKFVAEAHLDECIYELPGGSWGALAYENRGKTAKLSITTSDGAGSASTASAPLTLAFSDDAVQGALYFWSVADLGGAYESGILRAPFGAEKATPFILPGTAENPEACGGCHALSRNGEVIAFAAGEHSNSGHLTVASTSTPSQHYVKGGTAPTAVLMTLNPDGTRLLAARGDGVLDLWDTKAGTKLRQVSPQDLSGLAATHPEWSPDGSQIAVAMVPPDTFAKEPDGSWDTWSIKRGGIGVLPYNDGAFGPARLVVPVGDEEINGFPTYSPDGKWLAFVTGKGGGPYGDNTQNPNNRLRLVNIESGKTYELANATQAMADHAMPGSRATWPKFAPFMQADGNLMFLTFHSRLKYGFFTDTGALGAKDEQPWNDVQLWFAAVDLRRLAEGDPSAPPIYLTLQDPTRDNHLGLWTEKIGCQDAAPDVCGAYSKCEGNVCVPKPRVPK